MSVQQKISGDAGQLAFIDGLRGIAIWIVIAVHTAIAAKNIAPFAHERWMWISSAGARGVQLFFMVSAFTLFLSWSARQGSEANPHLNFFIRRIFRIMPMWWVACVTYTILDQHPVNLGVATAFMYFGFSQATLPSVVPGGWSIFAEETFYLFLPIIAVTVTSLPRALVFAAICVATQKLWWDTAAALHLNSSFDAIFYSPFNHTFCFGTGIVFYFIWKKQLSSTPDAMRAYGLGLDILTFASIYQFWIWNGEVFFGSIPLAICFVAAMVNSPIIGRLCRARWMRISGKYCFTGYLVHFIVINVVAGHLNPWVTKITNNGSAELRFLILYLPVMAGCIGFAAIAYHFVEKPFVRLGRRLIERLERRAANGSLAVN